MKNIVSVNVVFDDGSMESFLSFADLASVHAPKAVSQEVPVTEEDLPKAPTEEPSSDSSVAPSEELPVSEDNHDAPAEDNVLGGGEAEAPAESQVEDAVAGPSGAPGEAVAVDVSSSNEPSNV